LRQTGVRDHRRQERGDGSPWRRISVPAPVERQPARLTRALAKQLLEDVETMARVDGADALTVNPAADAVADGCADFRPGPPIDAQYRATGRPPGMSEGVEPRVGSGVVRLPARSQH